MYRRTENVKGANFQVWLPHDLRVIEYPNNEVVFSLCSPGNQIPPGSSQKRHLRLSNKKNLRKVLGEDKYHY